MGLNSSPPKRILVVDNDVFMRQLLSIGLQLGGYETVLAEHGGVAVRLLGQDRFDAIILDLEMPTMDGMQFLEWLRRVAQKNIPVIVFSAVDMDRYPELAKMLSSAGATEVLSKPAPLSAVLERLSRMLG